MHPEAQIAQKLISTNRTLALAESCTGGLIAHQLTNVPGSSQFLVGSIVAYSNSIKQKVLRVPATTLRRFGAVSEPTAISMAKQARRLFQADLSVSITGIAGPTGGTKLKPIGLTFIAISSAVETLCLECRFKGSRREIKQQAADLAIDTLLEFVS